MSFRKKGFVEAMALGHLAEDLWVRHLASRGLSVYMPDEGRSLWDMMDSDGTTYEIKVDVKAVMYAMRRNKEPNFYLEYFSTKRNEPCGIAVCESDILVYMVSEVSGRISSYVFDCEALKSHLMSSEYPSKGNKTSGDDNAMGYVVPIGQLINTPESGFKEMVVL